MTHHTAPDWQARGFWDGRISLIVVPLNERNTLFNGRKGNKWVRSVKWNWDYAWVDQGTSPAGNPGPYLKLPYPGDGDEWEGTVHRVYPDCFPGDRIWVREAWGWSVFASMPPSPQHRQFIRYRAYDDFTSVPNWRSPVTMPRWASRMDLIVTDMRIGRAQSIISSEVQMAGFGFMREFSERFGPDKWDANPWCCFASVSVERKGDHTNDQD